ncbi:MAG: hypothetical protein QM572_03230, partial [Nocardioides sp.]|uniref:hypothetical protein n=1 Tax=Nocardioides sp. TaxID=35761 RepID=UPI0039E49144
MITSRKAEQFDDLLEGRITEAPAELADLLAFAERVWAVPTPEPRAEFSAALRDRLMAAAPAALADGATDNRLTVDWPTAGGRPVQRRLAAAAAVFSIAAAA